MNTMLFMSLTVVSSGARIWLVRIFTVNKIKKKRLQNEAFKYTESAFQTPWKLV